MARGTPLVGARQQQGRGPAACSKTSGSRSIRSVSSGRWRRPRQAVSPSEYEQLPGDGRVCQAARNPQDLLVGMADTWPALRPCETAVDPGAGRRGRSTRWGISLTHCGTDQGSIRREPEIVIRAWSTSAEQRWVTSGERRSPDLAEVAAPALNTESGATSNIGRARCLLRFSRQRSRPSDTSRGG